MPQGRILPEMDSVPALHVVHGAGARRAGLCNGGWKSPAGPAPAPAWHSWSRALIPSPPWVSPAPPVLGVPSLGEAASPRTGKQHRPGLFPSRNPRYSQLCSLFWQIPASPGWICPKSLVTAAAWHGGAPGLLPQAMRNRPGLHGAAGLAWPALPPHCPLLL